MSPTNARALNTMRQRLKKHNPAYQEQMDAFREKPESSEEEAASGMASAMHEDPVGLCLGLSRVHRVQRPGRVYGDCTQAQRQHRHHAPFDAHSSLSFGDIVMSVLIESFATRVLRLMTHQDSL